MNWYGIQALRLLGLAKDIKLPRIRAQPRHGKRLRGQAPALLLSARRPAECGRPPRVTLASPMKITTRRGAVAFFIALGCALVAIAIALNITWIIHWRNIVPVAIGIVLFALIIAGLIVNTIFVVREIRRNEQYDSFLNAVTHELRTPVASIRLYLETLQSREVTDAQRREFYRHMLADTDRLMGTVDQVLRAAETTQKRRERNWTPVDMPALLHECVELARARHQLSAEALTEEYHGSARAATTVLGDPDELRSRSRQCAGQRRQVFAGARAHPCRNARRAITTC